MPTKKAEPPANPPQALAVRGAGNDLFASPTATEFHAIAAPRSREEIRQADPLSRVLSPALLWRHKWLILALFALIATPSVFVVWHSTPQQFTARGTIEILPGNGGMPEKISSSTLRLFMDTQRAMLMSQPVFERLLDDPEVQKSRWYNEIERSLFGSPLSRNERLKESINGGGIRGVQNLLNVTATTLRPADAAILANATMRAFIDYTKDRQQRNIELLYEQLRRQENDLKERVRGQETLVAQFRERLRTSDGDDLIKNQTSHVEALQHQLDDLAREIDVARHELVRLQSAATQPAAEAAAADRKPFYEKDPEWNRLRQQKEKIEFDMEVGRELRWGEKSPQMQTYAVQTRLIDEKIAARERELDARPMLPTAAGDKQNPARYESAAALQQDIESKEFRRKRMEEDLAKAQERRRRDQETADTLSQHVAELNRTREQLRQVEDNIAQREAQRELPPAMRVFSQAAAPNNPNNDKRLLNCGVACGASLFFAVLAALARVLFTRSVQTLQDVPSIGPAPFLGELPLATRSQPMPLEDCPIQSESMRMIRTALLQRMNGADSGVFLITSAGPKAGKTTVTAMLGHSLARLGKRVLLVDADLRNPSIAKRFGVTPEPGLLAALSSGAKDSAVVRETSTPGLCLLPSGRVADSGGAELLANGVFDQCLARWRNSFDIVLLDSPPVLPVADARILSRLVDGTLIVVREGHCKRTEVADCLAHLGLSGARIIGTIFIGSHARSRYDYAYGAYGYAPHNANGNGNGNGDAG
ncbi:MAG: polysaccharide biosynthesis tyrosine autokinase [Phycisphaerae bacterium]